MDLGLLVLTIAVVVAVVWAFRRAARWRGATHADSSAGSWIVLGGDAGGCGGDGGGGC
jgi:cbb3-type cytochrome oxidase subunit 3